MTAVENETSNVSNLVKKQIEAKYFTTSGYKKFTGKIVHKKIKEKELVDKSDIFGFIDHSNLDKKIATLAIKKLKSEQN